MKSEQRHKTVKRFLESKNKLSGRLLEADTDPRPMSKIIQDIYLRVELADLRKMEANRSFEEQFWDRQSKASPNRRVSWACLQNDIRMKVINSMQRADPKTIEAYSLAFGINLSPKDLEHSEFILTRSIDEFNLHRGCLY